MAKELLKEIRGSTYLHEETSNTPSKEVMQFLSVLYAKGYFKILCVYAAHPKTYRASTLVSQLFDYIWLTSRESIRDEQTLDPEREERFIYDIQEYLKENNPCAILIDITRFIPREPSGKEPNKKDLPPEWKSYHSQKNKLLKMIRRMVDDISESQSTCIFTMGKGTTDESFLAVLRRETSSFYNKETKKGLYIVQKIDKKYQELIATDDIQTINDTINIQKYPPEIMAVLLKTTNPLAAFKLLLKSKNPKKLIEAICKYDCPSIVFAKYALRNSANTKAAFALFIKKEDMRKLRLRMKKSENPTEELYDYLRKGGI
ncbi:hypothetical protein ACFLQI_01850 [Candidatus Undinarchaeota archaeon]